MSNRHHPIYSLVRLALLLTALTIILWLTASRFDDSELRTIMWMFLASASLEGGSQLVERFLDRRGNE